MGKFQVWKIMIEKYLDDVFNQKIQNLVVNFLNI